MDKEKSDLEHKVIDEKLESMKTKIYEGFRAINSNIEKGFELARAENKRQNEISNIQRDEILKKQDLTNGRVTALESVTSTLKYLQSHKKMAVLIAYTCYNMLQYATPSNIKKAIEWMKLLI